MYHVGYSSPTVLYNIPVIDCLCLESTSVRLPIMSMSFTVVSMYENVKTSISIENTSYLQAKSINEPYLTEVRFHFFYCLTVLIDSVPITLQIVLILGYLRLFRELSLRRSAQFLVKSRPKDALPGSETPVHRFRHEYCIRTCCRC